MTKKGRHTKPGVWDKAARLKLFRGSICDPNEKLDPGVNYFVAMLEQMGLETYFSCEGHPSGFYITFSAPYQKALDIACAGFFNVVIEAEGCWAIRLYRRMSERKRVDCLRWAAKAWEERFGPLDFKKIALSQGGSRPSMYALRDGR